MATTMRFVLLADERAGSAFNRFADKVDRANRSMDRNQGILRKQAKAQDAANGSLRGLTGTVLGFGDATGHAGGKMSMFGKAMLGLNLATGLLEPALAGLVVAAGGMAAAFAAAGAGAAAYGIALKPALTQVTTLMAAQDTATKAAKTAQANYANAIAAGVSPSVALANKQLALAASQRQLALATKAASPAVRQMAAGLKRAKDDYAAWGKSLERPVLAPLTTGLKFVRPALRAISPLVRAAAGAFKVLVTELGARIQAGGLRNIVTKLLPHVQPAILNLAHAFGNVAAGIWGVIKAFLPMSDTITGGVARLTARFKEWGQSLPSHSGFRSLMAMFKGQVPAVNALFKNLAVIIKNVAGAMTGIATPANSKALTQILVPLSQIMVKLTANAGLVRSVLYFMLLKSAAKQMFMPLKGVSAGIGAIGDAASGVKTAYGAVGRLAGGFRDARAAESAFSGVAGTMGGKLRTAVDAVISAGGAVVKYGKGLVALGRAEGFAAVMSRVLGTAMIALPWVAVAAAVIALAYLIIKYHRQIWAFVQKIWDKILGAIAGVWGWVKKNWPLLVAILTGPFGIAVLVIIRNWGRISGAAKVAWNTITTIMRGAVVLIRGFAADIWDAISGVFSKIVHGAASAFGWIPGLGGKLKDAAAAFDRFRAQVDAAIRGVHGKNVALVFSLDLPAGVSFPSRHIKGHAAAKGVKGAAPGWWLTGEEGPELVRMRGGEDVLTAPQTRRALGGYAAGTGLSLDQAFPATAGLTRMLQNRVDSIAKALAKIAQVAGGTAMIKYAESFIGHVPYVWGGTTPSGWDCSGYTSWVYHHFGRPDTPRTSEQQGAWVQRTAAVPGALAFFTGAGGPSPGHVGLIVGKNLMVNAAGTRTGTSYGDLSGMLYAGLPPGGFRAFDRGGLLMPGGQQHRQARASDSAGCLHAAGPLAHARSRPDEAPNPRAGPRRADAEADEGAH